MLKALEAKNWLAWKGKLASLHEVIQFSNIDAYWGDIKADCCIDGIQEASDSRDRWSFKAYHFVLRSISRKMEIHCFSGKVSQNVWYKTRPTMYSLPKAIRTWGFKHLFCRSNSALLGYSFSEAFSKVYYLLIVGTHKLTKTPSMRNLGNLVQTWKSWADFPKM